MGREEVDQRERERERERESGVCSFGHCQYNKLIEGVSLGEGERRRGRRGVEGERRGRGG